MSSHFMSHPFHAGCSPGQSPCSSNRSQCIDNSYFCNGYPDCMDGSDENLCRKYYKVKGVLGIGSDQGSGAVELIIRHSWKIFWAFWLSN